VSYKVSIAGCKLTIVCYKIQFHLDFNSQLQVYTSQFLEKKSIFFIFSQFSLLFSELWDINLQLGLY